MTVAPEFYKIVVGGEWAYIFLDVASGTFSANTSFGQFGHSWPRHGCESLKATSKNGDFGVMHGA